MNLDAYLARIGCDGPTLADANTLRRIHRAHATTIPFENLDIQLGLPIDLALPALERKLVLGRRGGYCFEHNSLLLAALRAIAFDAISCEARVFDPGEGVTPRTHMLLVVSLNGRDWLCDVGFGGATPLEPVPLDGTEVEQGGTRYRVAARAPIGGNRADAVNPAKAGFHVPAVNPAKAGFHVPAATPAKAGFHVPKHVPNGQVLRVLQADEGSGWVDRYVFEKTPREAIDFDVANWYTSTHPDSRFAKTLTAQQRTASGSKVLRNLQWTVRSGPFAETRQIARDDLGPLLAAEFGIRIPAGARLRALDGDPREPGNDPPR